MIATGAPLIVHVDDVDARPNLHATDGWVDVDIRFLTEALGVTDRAFTLFRTVLPPGAMHMPHIHPNADEFVFVVAGTAQLGEEHTVTEAGPGTLHYVPAGHVHWVGTRSDAPQAVELLGAYVGASSLDEAGYRPVDKLLDEVRGVVAGGATR